MGQNEQPKHFRTLLEKEDAGAIAVAFSGGGIRSAAFNSGVNFFLIF